jgi:hypothetical protein
VIDSSQAAGEVTQAIAALQIDFGQEIMDKAGDLVADTADLGGQAIDAAIDALEDAMPWNR